MFMFVLWKQSSKQTSLNERAATLPPLVTKVVKLVLFFLSFNPSAPDLSVFLFFSVSFFPEGFATASQEQQVSELFFQGFLLEGMNVEEKLTKQHFDKSCLPSRIWVVLVPCCFFAPPPGVCRCSHADCSQTGGLDAVQGAESCCSLGAALLCWYLSPLPTVTQHHRLLINHHILIYLCSTAFFL